MVNFLKHVNKSMHQNSASLKNHSFNVETQCAVFDTYVTSVLLYGSEIWGWHKSGDVENIHVNFCRKVLGVGPIKGSN